MKRKFFIIFLTACFSLAFTPDNNIIEVRNLFYRSTESEEASDSLFQLMENVDGKINPAMLGYKSMSHFMICYHTINPYTKYKYFLSGKEIMEEAIQNHPENIELRFLRLTIQLNVPSFLGYSKDIERDKKMILTNAKKINDSDLFTRIYRYTITAKKLSEEEKRILQLALKENKLSKQSNE